MLTIPKGVVDRDYQAFPEGSYVGDLNRVETTERGEEGADDWRVFLRLFLRNISAGDEETEDPGNRPLRMDIPVIWDGTAALEVDDTAQIVDLPFPLQNGIVDLTQLALALGAAQRDEKGNASVDLPTFVQALREGNYDDSRVRFVISHYVPKNQPDRKYEQFAGIAAAE